MNKIALKIAKKLIAFNLFAVAESIGKELSNSGIVFDKGNMLVKQFDPLSNRYSDNAPRKFTHSAPVKEYVLQISKMLLEERDSFNSFASDVDKFEHHLALSEEEEAKKYIESFSKFSEGNPRLPAKVIIKNSSKKVVELFKDEMSNLEINTIFAECSKIKKAVTERLDVLNKQIDGTNKRLRAVNDLITLENHDISAIPMIYAVQTGNFDSVPRIDLTKKDTVVADITQASENFTLVKFKYWKDPKSEIYETRLVLPISVVTKNNEQYLYCRDTSDSKEKTFMISRMFRG